MNQTGTMKEMLKEERPYEKCERYGVKSLTDIELLAILLRTGTRKRSALELARMLLYPKGRSVGLSNLYHYTREQLLEMEGIGTVKANQILSVLELCRRIAKESAQEELCFTNPETIATYYMEDLRHEKQEQMKLLLLNTKTKLIGETDISKGTVNASLITPRELFIDALQKNAVYIIVLHNHPSGDPTPSEEDIILTKRIREVGKLIGIELLDHIIIGDNRYISLAEEGLLY